MADTLVKVVTDLLNVMKSRDTTMPPVTAGEGEVYIIFLSNHIF